MILTFFCSLGTCTCYDRHIKSVGYFSGKGNWLEICGAILVFCGALLAPVYDVIKSRMSSKTDNNLKTKDIGYKPVTQKMQEV